MKDIIDEKGDFLSHDTLNNKFGINCNFLECLQVRQSIFLDWRKELQSRVKEPINDSLNFWTKNNSN